MLAAYLQLAGAMALVGANVAVAKLLAAALPIPLIAGLRCAIACLVLWPLSRWRDPPTRLSAGLVANLVWQAALGTVLYNLALLAGLRLTGALQGGLVLATLPAVVALGSALWLRETLTPRHWAATALAVGGMLALTATRVPAEAGSLAGAALVFAAVCGEAAYILLARRIAGRLPVITTALWMQVFSTALLLPLALPVLPDAAALAEPRLALLLLFHSLTASVLCLLLWYAGLRRVPAGVAGVFTVCLPITATLVAVAVLGEAVSLAQGMGLGLMLGSVLLATWPRRITA